MAKESNEDERVVNHAKYPDELEFLCPACGHRVHFCYSNPKHDYSNFTEKMREIRNQYCCTNPDCELSRVCFNPAPLNVLPRKQYSLAVWKYIAIEAKIHHQKPVQIVERIWETFHVVISESTVRNYIDEIDVYVAGKIDERTVELIREQGFILLSFDGQEPDENGPSLWLFIDVISNRVLRVAVLESADHVALHEIVDSIVNDYNVKLIGMISDKQNSIVKMHDMFYPDIPHQYCHFHFLQNMWNHLEVKDGHLHKELAKEVNRLYITSVSKSAKKNMKGIGKQGIRKLFAEIEKDLRKLVKNSSRKFDRLRGIETCKKLTAYVDDIEQACATEDSSMWVVQTLLKTATRIRDRLAANQIEYEDCVALNQQFHEIQALLGNPDLVKAEKIMLMDGVFEGIWKYASEKEGIASKDNVRTLLLNISNSREKILLEWVRLYESYKPGLFAYYDFPVPERTNVKIEKKFGQEKTLLFSQCARTRVGMQVRTHGEFILKELFAGKEEIKSIVRGIEGEFDDDQVKAGLEELERRTKEETECWKSNIGGIEVIKSILKFGRKEHEKGDLDEIKS